MFKLLSNFQYDKITLEALHIKTNGKIVETYFQPGVLHTELKTSFKKGALQYIRQNEYAKDS